MNKLQIGIITILITSIFACGVTKNKTSKTAENSPETAITIDSEKWTTSSENGYTIKYPESWQFDNSSGMGTVFMILSPLESANEQFRENVNLIIEDLSGTGITLEEYGGFAEGQIKKFITEAKILQSEKKDNIYEMIYTGKQGVFNLKFWQHYQVMDEKAYVLTLTCEEDKFDEYKNKGEKILNSFKLVNK